jgi:chromatin segregation and condensation protein Rec8/ScpA/Scc1 (kleisin family)
MFQPDKEVLKYQDMVDGKLRKTVAGTFFELLVLKTMDVIDVRQDQPYGDIFVTKTVSH